jgi:TonB family protein
MTVRSNNPTVQSIGSARRTVLTLMVAFAAVIHASAALQQMSIDELRSRLNSQYSTIQKTIAAPPSPGQYPLPSDYHRKLREWQDDLAQAFGAAATTVREIIKLNPPDSEYWHERLETLELYSQPVSSPEQRNVFGAGEVQPSAHLLEMPAAEYTAEAQAARAHGEVRLRLVLASDATVKDVFPIKSLPWGLTDAAMKAARQIKFEPAIRNGKPASQFITLVYEFRNGKARAPYVPRTIF